MNASTRGLSSLSRWRQDSRPVRAVSTYVGVALSLTVLATILNWTLDPPTGLIRTLYPDPAFAGEPLAQDRSTDISLGFLDDDPQLPRTHVSVHWRGFWYLPRQRTVQVSASGDGVEVYLDRRLVLGRSSDRGPSTTSQPMKLAAGPHELIVRCAQREERLTLEVLQAPVGETPAAFPSSQLFYRKPGATDFRTASGLRWLNRLVVAVWLLPPGLAMLVLGWRSEARAWTPPPAREFARRMSRLSLPALLSPVLLFLVGPHTIYEANHSEFSVPFVDVAWPWLLAAVGTAWLLLMAIGAVICLLSSRVRQAYVALLLAVGLLLWIQGNFLVADFGPLYGEGLNLGLFAWRAPYEAGLWIGGALLALVYARTVANVAPLVSGLLITLQVAALGVSVRGAAGEDRPDEAWSRPPQRLYQLSRRRNVIHIVLDGFFSQVFADAVEHDRAGVDRAYPGFVFFADHLGAFPTTRASMPAMLTGVAYRDRVPFNEFLAKTTLQRSIATYLANHGYVIHSVTFDSRDHPHTPDEAAGSIVRYRIPTPYGSHPDYLRFAALQLFDLSLFRHAPQGLKPYVYNDQAWLAQSQYMKHSLQTSRARAARPSNHAAFFEEFTGRLAATRDEAVYTFIHLAIPHPPIVLGAGCSFLGPRSFDTAGYTAQAECGLLLVRHLLERLRTLDVYDDSVVVLTSDHGWSVTEPDDPFRRLSSPAGDMERVVTSARPLLAIKPPAAAGPLRISYAPTAVTDIPATIVDLLGLPNPFPGTPVFQLDASVARRRTFAYHSWENADWGRPYLDKLYIFSVTGRVSDPDAWAFQRTIEPGADSLPPG